MAKWAAFSVVLFHESHEEVAFEFWEWFGDGISSRHAEFCVSLFSFLNSDSDRSEYQNLGPASYHPSAMTTPEWFESYAQNKIGIKSRLTSSARSADSALKAVCNDDVFLYATGMVAISAIARALARTSEDSAAMVYGKISIYSSLRWRQGLDAQNRFGFLVVCDDTLGTSVNYPTMVASAPLFKRYRRPDGGYGFLFGVIFREPASAVVFYDNLDVWKGPTVGTKLLISIPYSALAHAKEQDWAAAHGVPKHIVRLSVGLENYSDLVVRIGQALQLVEMRENMSSRC
ncbi:hypothetical protein F1880_001518 [Penicillium rolfsii]|nr:hypothetical protein F1880_001518 [Penicillium rolfsii]